MALSGQLALVRPVLPAVRLRLLHHPRQPRRLRPAVRLRPEALSSQLDPAGPCGPAAPASNGNDHVGVMLPVWEAGFTDASEM